MKLSKLTATLIIIIIVLIVCLVVTGPNKSLDKYGKEKREIDSLSLLIKDLEKSKQEQYVLIQGYEKQVIVLDHKIDSTEQNILDTRKYYEKKIKNTTKYTTTELDSFFTDRYK